MLLLAQDASTITSIISSVGFPIVMCLIMVKMMRDNADKHEAEMDKVTESLNNNTMVIQKLCDKMEEREK